MRILRTIFIVLLFAVVAVTGFCFRIAGKYVVPVIMYHHVEDVPSPRANYVSPAKFEWHMDFLKTHGYHVLSLDKLVRGLREGKAFPWKSVVITFDDGYANNYKNAFPVLKKYGFPATIFVIAGVVGEEGFLTWNQIREMEQHGVTVGSHTVDHSYLPELSTDQKRVQIFESKRILESAIGHPVDYFAYPSGGFDEVSKALVRDAGYRAACATNRGFDPENRDVFELNRIRFSDKDNFLPILWMKTSGYYNFFRERKEPY